MTDNTPDLFANGIEFFSRELRDGSFTAEQATRHCLTRINTLDPQLGAFEHIDETSAVEAARNVDARLAAGDDAGPLMGVPLAIKDIFAVSGMPVTNGSNCATAELTGPEGTIVKRLREAGCVILGKTKTVEFALGATGLNASRGTPWNPWDLDNHRIPGGSSSGSAVATTTGMCGFALGTDTGGSVRIPACFNSLFGHKTTVGLWPTDGVFPLSPTFDSIGPLCRTAGDAAIIHTAITAQPVPSPPSLAGLRFGKPVDYFLDDLDPEVMATFNKALDMLRAAGVTIVDVDCPEARERETLFPLIVPPELISRLTVERFSEARATMDPVTASRAAVGLEVGAVKYLEAQIRRQELEIIAEKKMENLDGWLSPTCPFVPMTLESLADPEQHSRSLEASRNTQPGNIFGFCAASIPVGQLGSALPTGLQLMCKANEDARLLSLAIAIENLLGRYPLPHTAL